MKIDKIGLIWKVNHLSIPIEDISCLFRKINYYHRLDLELDGTECLAIYTSGKKVILSVCGKSDIYLSESDIKSLTPFDLLYCYAPSVLKKVKEILKQQGAE